MTSAADKSTAAAPSAAVTATAAWLIASFFYAYQYLARSAPSVMAPQLMAAFGLDAAGLSTLTSLFYWAYAPVGLLAGMALDLLGPRRTAPLAAAAAGVGAFLIAAGVPPLAAVGMLLLGSGSVFAIVSAAYIASTGFPPSRSATLIGVTQMIGMTGAAAGQFVVGPAVSAGLGWDEFWGVMGFCGLAIGGLLFVFLPQAPQGAAAPKSPMAALRSIWTVACNPQSILCGLIAGLMFAPTTVFSMVWGVRYLQEGHGVDYLEAVMRSASVLVGWIVGCPLLGMLSDRIGRRKPVVIGSAAVLMLSLLLILRGPSGVFPPYSLGLVAGLASGAAMVTYTVIKEVNPPGSAGAATGVISLLNFSIAALLGPALGMLLARASGGGARELGHYQTAFAPLVYGVGLAILLALFLRETGPAASVQRRTT